MNWNYPNRKREREDDNDDDDLFSNTPKIEWIKK